MPVDFGPPADPHDHLGGQLLEQPWLTPVPTGTVDLSPADQVEQKADVELAFVAALQRLPARQRAVLLLREVLGFTAQETADALTSTPASVNSALQRAHRTLDGVPAEVPRHSPADDPAATMAMVARFVDAWERNDVDSLVLLLAEDVELSMPPFAEWFRGRAPVAAFLRSRPMAPGHRWRGLPVAANDRPGCALYLAVDGRWTAHSINVLSLSDGLVTGFTAFLDASLFPAFGLPATLDGPA
jgi:RNA polymerase sigma-70 factor (ECF subfamily)